jgi:hypothetical protein
LVPVTVLVHKGVIGSRVTVKLVWYPQTSKFSVVRGLVIWGWIYVDAAKMEENWELHTTSPVERALVSVSPGFSLK